MPDISQDEFEAKLPHLAPATAAELRQRANSGGSRSASSASARNLTNQSRPTGSGTDQRTVVREPAYGYKREISHRYVMVRQRTSCRVFRGFETTLHARGNVRTMTAKLLVKTSRSHDYPTTIVNLALLPSSASADTLC
uniref:Uncharacterized protein n=1 Tax=Anopheles maculatus TaxID=74869 RepID=A0A182SYV2_9DIPT